MVTDIVERLFDAQITTSARARDKHDAEVYAVLIDAAEEVKRLREKCDKQSVILRRLTPENYPGMYFIAGDLGEKDQNGMPKKILVVPSYGVDFSYIYVYSGKVTGPEW